MSNWVVWLIWLSVLLSIGSVVFALLMVTRIPVDYLTRPTSGFESFREHHPLLRIVLIAAKNMLGLLFVTAGTIMLLTPGQGVLFIAMGVLLLDFPGKRKMERRLLGSHRVFQALNKIREKAGQPPLNSPKD